MMTLRTVSVYVNKGGEGRGAADVHRLEIASPTRILSKQKKSKKSTFSRKRQKKG